MCLVYATLGWLLWLRVLYPTFRALRDLLHTRECSSDLPAVVSKLTEPHSPFVFANVRRQYRDFIFRRQLRQLAFHGLYDRRFFHKPAGAIFTKIDHEDQRERLTRLAFARKVGDCPGLAVVEDLKVFLRQVRDWQVRLFVFDERVEKDDARFDANR